MKIKNKMKFEFIIITAESSDVQTKKITGEKK